MHLCQSEYVSKYILSGEQYSATKASYIRSKRRTHDTFSIERRAYDNVHQFGLGWQHIQRDPFFPKNRWSLSLMSDDMNGSDVFVRAGDLVKNRSGVRFLSDIANSYVLDCDGHEAVLVNGHWMGTVYSAQSFTMMTLNADQARIVGFEFDDVRPLFRAVHIPKADRDPRGSLRIVR